MHPILLRVQILALAVSVKSKSGLNYTQTHLRTPFSRMKYRLQTFLIIHIASHCSNTAFATTFVGDIDLTTVVNIV